ncbi:MinD/ParA family protein [Mycobacterium sp. OTB74]|jgi:MinD-like ATPase involved in chromosome partitioning or flagellar assembly|uniref:MinD/ParA family ATP-binding protein n=1 Tax=Mycobacterium sp. OTB74 TaxID=1853452 RepID=UPI002475EA1F|nr:MinD/ParA family protein [Mycobacterium sp. OTB74]MDH6244940.1 MinD-like ATPase involved in chromosome partitioning or flagellar assembly [Mycobacterium sp. OTB74]
MTERQGEHSDDQAGPPPRPPEFPERYINPSDSMPHRLESDSPEPPSAESGPSGDPPPGLGGGALLGEAPSFDPIPFEKVFQWQVQPGTQHSAAPDVRAGRSTASVPDGLAPHGDTARPALPIGPPDSGGLSEPVTQAPPRPDRFAQYEQQPYNIAPKPGEPPPRPAAFTARPGQSRQQPPTPAQRSPGGWPAGGQGFNHAQGSAANWNYLEDLRSGELVPIRRIPPGRGWRKALYVASFKLINLGQSPDERYQGELETKTRSLLRGTYKIGVLGKGGVGKSTIAASVGSVFAELRQDDRLVAIDADTGFGKLASLIDPATSGSYWELAADKKLFTFSDIRSRVGSNKFGLFVLAGEAATARRRVLDAAIYREATMQLDKHFTLSIVDCGSTLDSAVTQQVLADVDALIVVSSPWHGGASAAGQMLEWLANNGFTGLLHSTVVVVNDSDGHSAKHDRALLVERFGKRGQKVIEIPFDAHLRPGGVIDIREELNRRTRRRLLELAAACAEYFAATAERPRGHDDYHRRQGGHRRIRDAEPGIEPGAAAGRRSTSDRPATSGRGSAASFS